MIFPSYLPVEEPGKEIEREVKRRKGEEERQKRRQKRKKTEKKRDKREREKKEKEKKKEKENKRKPPVVFSTQRLLARFALSSPTSSLFSLLLLPSLCFLFLIEKTSALSHIDFGAL